MTLWARRCRMLGGEANRNPPLNEDNTQAKSVAGEELELNAPKFVKGSNLESGHFVNIYEAKYNGNAVVAETLKENYAANDLFLMKAKIKFLSEKVGDNPNVLKCLGSILDDTSIGPTILYEYCENGTFKKYLVNNKANLTVETLFCFGLDIAKGMQYLAGKGITHGRLMA
ncbi:hypothetical protein DPMN_059484 [Dreissena polymorpha]|uniref:Protein kinase domain-containing protein n=2 Tax=Dreissena polymorpha TaxID=45954 RepID=A0A9D4C3Y2_DREPO|nr:hypothetical protein DPMN_059484 [Dreissena polymorpha]